MSYTFKKLQLLPLLLFLVVTMIGCSKAKTNNSVILTIDAPSQSDSVIKVMTYGMLNYEENIAVEDKIGSMGKGKFELNVSKPFFANLKIGEYNYNKIYLEPGYELNISLVLNNKSLELQFTGIGSERNNYLTKSSLVWADFYKKNPTWWEADLYSFSKMLDSLENDLEDIHFNYTDKGSINAEDQKLLQATNRLNVINLKQQHRLIKNDLYKIEAIPVSLTDISKDIPFEAQYLELSMIEYAKVLDLFLRSELQEPALSDVKPEQLDSVKQHLPAITNEKIKEKNFPAKIEEFLLAKNIDFWLASEGISSGLIKSYSEFKMNFANSSYTRQIKKDYDKWMKISKGQPAPEITGVTVENDTVMLSDLRGKIVYIDVWATWCKPCIAELPFYKSLQEEIEDNDAVEFLFVSIDNNSDAWTNFLIKETMPEGIQVNEIEIVDHTTVQDSYKMWGIPRYILIDAEGKIVNANAPRPSSGKVTGIIKELIAL